jgi:hypothetical protein
VNRNADVGVPLRCRLEVTAAEGIDADIVVIVFVEQVVDP